jgi:hypothetical protein
VQFKHVLAFPLLSAGVACASRASLVPPAEPATIHAQPRIVTSDEVLTEAELAARAERALLEQRWADAAHDYGLLAAAAPDGPQAPEYLFDLGLSLEGGQERARARDTFLDLSRRFPTGRRARAALMRAASLDAYLEDWRALGAIGETLLAQPSLDDVERIVALGARGLGRIELGDDRAASQDILDGLEVADQQHYGAREVLPVAVAELHFALGEVRRVRSERIQWASLPANFHDEEFLQQLDRRCAGLLEAQAAYTQAVRSVDPHWAVMAGDRVGEMYRALHADLMQIPPPAAKTERQRKVFYAFMHVRYRVLLEKGLREIEQTIALGQRTGDSSPWIDRALAEKDRMLAGLEDEKSQIAKMPFTEGEIQEALSQLQKRTAKR